MKKSWSILGLIVLVIVVVVGGFLVFHKSKSTSTSGSTTSSNQSQSVNNSVLLTKSSSANGNYLTDPSGKTLYTYSGDSANTSNCTGSCLASWPGYYDSGATTGLPTNVGAITRTDNSKKQFTYKGMPLYYFTGDSSSGVVSGNGVSGFYVAKP